MKKYNKVFLILLVVFIIFNFCFVYAGTFIDTNYDYLYSYSHYTNDELKSLRDTVKNDNRVVSGEFYYFVVYNYGDRIYNTFLIRKSCVDTALSLHFANWGEAGWEGFQVKLSTSDLQSSGDFIHYSGRNGFAKLVDNNNYYAFNLFAQFDSTNKIYKFIYESNYTGDIFRDCANDERKYLQRSSPYIMDSDYSLANFDSTYFLVKPNKVDSSTSLNFNICKGKSKTEIDEVLLDIELNSNSLYYHSIDGSDVWYEVPYSLLSGKSVKKGDMLFYDLGYYEGENWRLVSREITVAKDYTFSSGSGEDIEKDPNQSIIDSNKQTQDAINNQTNAINDQTNAIKEGNETNKNIFESIKEVLSYINPFSENFFVYKLLELLFEGIKALFIPSSDFFSNFFTELSNWFSDRLGFLWSPFDVVIHILNRILNINFSEPVLELPVLKEPFSDTILFSGFTYNLNDLLKQETFNTMYNIYIMIVDALVFYGLIKLAEKKIKGVFGN